MNWPVTIKITKPNHPVDARGWIGLGCYILVLVVLGMMWADRALLKDDFFKLLATAIVLTGWNNGPVGWAYQATQGGGEAARSSAKIAETVAGVAPNDHATPQPVTVVNPASDPVQTEQVK